MWFTVVATQKHLNYVFPNKINTMFFWQCCACSLHNFYAFSPIGYSYLLAFTLAGNKHKTDVYLALQEYLQLAKKYYSAEPQSVDFVGAANAIRREINSTVEHQTEGKL